MTIPDPIPESVDDIANPNVQARRSQNLRWLLLIGAAAALGGGLFYVMNFRKPASGVAAQQKAFEQRTIATGEVAAPASISPEAENVQMRGQMSDLRQELSAVQQQNAQLSTQNAGLNEQIAEAASRPRDIVPMRADPRSDQAGQDIGASMRSEPFPMGPGAASETTGTGAAAPAQARRRSLRVVGSQVASSSGGDSNTAGPQLDKISVFDSSQYVAPNSYVTAKVLVGVDMQTGMAATADPKPVLFRVEGLATGVGASGRFQTSNLKGCLVNGAAFAELSSEKVYIKLQQITCSTDATHYMVAKVDGYVTFMGKSGVRGKVVSREGNFASKAFVAGTLQGLGQAVGTDTQRRLEGLTSTDGAGGLAMAPLSDSQVGQAALGTGIGNASSMLADYYIKRAEQYQPVIEMPSGMDVELVFLAGFPFTNKGASQ